LSSEFGLPPGVLGGFLKGRWTPDLSLSDYPDCTRVLAKLFAGGAKFLGGGHSRTRALETDEIKDDVKVPMTPFLRLAIADTEVLVFPELICLLSTYSFERERTPELFSSLRLRAQEWVKKRYLCDDVAALGLPVSIALSCVPTIPQQVASRLLSEGAGETSVESGPKGWCGGGGKSPLRTPHVAFTAFAPALTGGVKPS